MAAGLGMASASEARRARGSRAEARSSCECTHHGQTEFVLEGRGVLPLHEVPHGRRSPSGVDASKLRLVEEAGGRCVLCGYDRVPGRTPVPPPRSGDRSAFASQPTRGLTRSFARRCAEAAKCVLLCANCHAEVEGASRDARRARFERLRSRTVTSRRVASLRSLRGLTGLRSGVAQLVERTAVNETLWVRVPPPELSRTIDPSRREPARRVSGRLLDQLGAAAAPSWASAHSATAQRPRRGTRLAEQPPRRQPDRPPGQQPPRHRQPASPTTPPAPRSLPCRRPTGRPAAASPPPAPSPPSRARRGRSPRPPPASPASRAANRPASHSPAPRSAAPAGAGWSSPAPAPAHPPAHRAPPAAARTPDPATCSARPAPAAHRPPAARHRSPGSSKNSGPVTRTCAGHSRGYSSCGNVATIASSSLIPP